MKFSTVQGLAEDIRMLNSDEIRVLVSLLSSDYTEERCSTMAAMDYVYTTAPATQAQNVFTRK